VPTTGLGCPVGRAGFKTIQESGELETMEQLKHQPRWGAKKKKTERREEECECQARDAGDYLTRQGKMGARRNGPARPRRNALEREHEDRE